MQTFVWLKSSHALGSKFTQKWQKSKRIVQYVWKKSCFSFFGNFLDEIISVNKIKNQENFFESKSFLFQVSIPSCGGLPGSSHQFWRWKIARSIFETPNQFYTATDSFGIFFSLMKLPQCQNFGSHFILLRVKIVSILPKWRVISLRKICGQNTKEAMFARMPFSEHALFSERPSKRTLFQRTPFPAHALPSTRPSQRTPFSSHAILSYILSTLINL